MQALTYSVDLLEAFWLKCFFVFFKYILKDLLEQ